MTCKTYAIKFPTQSIGKKGAIPLKECGRISWNRFVVSVPNRRPAQPYLIDDKKECNSTPILMMAPCQPVSSQNEEIVLNRPVSVVAADIPSNARTLPRPKTAHFPARPPLSGSIRTRTCLTSPQSTYVEHSTAPDDGFSGRNSSMNYGSSLVPKRSESRISSAQSGTSSMFVSRFPIRGSSQRPGTAVSNIMNKSSAAKHVDDIFEELLASKNISRPQQTLNNEVQKESGLPVSATPVMTMSPEPEYTPCNVNRSSHGELAFTVMPFQPKYHELYTSSKQGTRPLPAVVRQLIPTNHTRPLTQFNPNHVDNFPSNDYFFQEPLPTKKLSRKSATARLFVGSTVMKRPQTAKDSQPVFIFNTRAPLAGFIGHHNHVTPRSPLHESSSSSIRDSYWNVTEASSPRSFVHFN